MSDGHSLQGPLAGLRILELANETGQFCGKLLGDLGADVVKIEPPGGEPSRRIGPFLDDIPAIMAALLYRTATGQGQYIDASIHDACALTTEAAIANYVYRGEVLDGRQVAIMQPVRHPVLPWPADDLAVGTAALCWV